MDNRTSRRLNRVGLIATLGLAMAVAPLTAAQAQGQCKGRPAEHTPACDTTPAKAPFEATGWKTVAVDHFVMQAVDYKKEAAYYAALMNWKLRSDDGKEAVMDIGPIGTVITRVAIRRRPRRQLPRRQPVTRQVDVVAVVAVARAPHRTRCGT